MELEGKQSFSSGSRSCVQIGPFGRVPLEPARRFPYPGLRSLLLHFYDNLQNGKGEKLHSNILMSNALLD